MAISPINITRVSHHLKTMSLLDSLQRNARALLIEQTRLSTGRSFITPSDDPIAASQALHLHASIKKQNQILDNLLHADLMLSSSDDALREVNDLLIQAEAIASSSIGALAGPEQTANAELIASIRERLMEIGNRNVNGSYLFAGRDTQSAPFVSALGGVAYVGDTGDILTRVSPLEQVRINALGSELFGALSAAIGSSADLSPELTLQTRLEDLGGANLKGVRKGIVLLADTGGTLLQVDLTSADTVGDVVDMINAAAVAGGLNVSIQIDGSALSVTGSGVTIRDAANGATASDLGIVFPPSDPSSGTVANLRPRVTPNTPLASLNGGAGISLDGGIRITNGNEIVEIDFSDAVTVQDVLNKINTAGIFVRAGINALGTGIEVVSQVSGMRTGISEVGGTAAASLGLISLRESTPLQSLNFGAGVEILPGEPDLRITAKDGAVFDVNLDGAETVGEVVDMINAAASDAGVSVEAALSVSGSGIAIGDNTGGTGALSVGRASEASFAVDDLGLLKSVPDPETELVGDDVTMVRADGIFTALMELERSLRENDERGISLAAQRVTEFSRNVTREHGLIGAQAQAMHARVEQTENAVATTRALLSQVEDADYTEVITRFQQAQTALQASLLSGSQLMNLSLMDFIR